MPKRFDDYDRVAVVTGSDSGIGEAVAVVLANEGFDVGVTWHSDEAGARGTAEEVRAAGRKCEVRQFDLVRLPDAAAVVDDLAGPFLCSQRAARRMLAGGRITNITSVHERAPRVGSGAYCAAKGGLGLLTKVMAQELAADGITVNAVAPLVGPQAGSHLRSDDWRNG
ncbi:MAG TPA: SDR family NAD(P)-dependent oxidoreductase [Planosporangium sp.]|nr:SDR family NAD(P)-dependent oxidoreductase [Planosporangium sp.]